MVTSFHWSSKNFLEFSLSALEYVLCRIYLKYFLLFSNPSYFHLICTLATSIGVLEFSRIEIERKPQKKFQILLSLWLSTGEAAQRKGGSFELTCGLTLLGCFCKLGTKGACPKVADYLKVAGFLYWYSCLVTTCSEAALWCKMVDCSLSPSQEGRIAVKLGSAVHGE